MINRPILHPDVEEQVLDSVAQYKHADKWRAWGMDLVRDQGSCVLYAGPPGTGKTMTARWVAHKLKRGFKKLSAAEIGGGDPGSTEKNLIAFFADCKKRNNATIFVDECDHLLMSRDKMEGAALTWQLGTEEAMMVELNTYKGLVILATNHAQNLDPALAGRLLAVVNFKRPDFERRKLIWKQKIPDKFPFQPTESELAIIAKFNLNGRQIENVIVNVASHAIRGMTKPSLKSFVRYCKTEKDKHFEATNE